MKVPRKEANMYGMIKVGEVEGDVAGLIEKPEEGQLPSDLASIGRYVLTPEIFNTLKRLRPGKAGELQLADAIDLQAKNGNVEYIRYHGKYFDCGSVRGYVNAITHEARVRSIV